MEYIEKKYIEITSKQHRKNDSLQIDPEAMRVAVIFWISCMRRMAAKEIEMVSEGINGSLDCNKNTHNMLPDI